MARMIDRALVTCGYADCKPCMDDGYESGEMAVAAKYLYYRVRNGTLAHESFDLGAHTGLWSAFLAGEYVRYGGGYVYALEPDPENFAALTENARRLTALGAAGVKPIQAAAWNSNAELALRRVANPARHSVSGLNAFNTGRGRCRGLALDRVPIIDGASSTLDFVKVDVEGAELMAVSGMRKTIESNPALLILVEYCPAHFKRYGYDTEKMTALMGAAGMRPARSIDTQLLTKIASVPNGIVKVFFTKGDSPWR